MRLGPLLLALSACAVGQGASSAQQAQSRTGTGYYELPDYSYFSEPPPAPSATPAPQARATPSPAVQAVGAAADQAKATSVAAGDPDSASATVQGAAHAYPKGNLAKAKTDGRALATTGRRSAAALPTGVDLPSTIPGYTPAAQPGEVYADDPDGLTNAGRSAAGGNASWKLVTDPARKVIALAPGDIAGAREVEKDPGSFLSGEALGAADASCRPLSPSSGTDYYEATCNAGARVTEAPATCTGQMVPTVVNTLRWFYYGAPDAVEGMGFARQSVMEAKVSAGVCRAEAASKHVCDAQIDMGAGGSNVEDYRRWCKTKRSGTARLYSCTSEIASNEIPAHRNFATGTVYLRTEGIKTVTVARDEGTCPGMEADPACSAQGGEVCTEGPETRTIEGVAVTQACWRWSRPFMCHTISQASDCTNLERGGTCAHVRDECLDDPRDGPCKVTSKVYKCPFPAKSPNDAAKFICGDDVYCIDGTCEPVEREASTEFRDAVVGLHVLGQAKGEFDPGTMTLFSGTNETCSKKIFGASNCCSGKGVPLLTPWLCSAGEKTLDEKDDKGLCHKLGSYCSDKILGICVTSKDAYCCFESKLSRILQEQGRTQIGRPWGPPKAETCKGFSLDDFARLDLSTMDFAEVYAEFTGAAKLPDEIETSRQIQERIKAYYDARGPP